MRLLIILSVIIPLVFVVETVYGAEWYDSDWNKARQILTDSGDFDSTLTDYPVYVNITSIDLGVDTQADCDDIVFTNYWNASKLSHEIETCDTTNDILEAWIKLPNAYSNGTIFYLYYGNSGSGWQQDSQNVWNSNYVAVHHLNGTFVDSTANGHTITNQGTSAQSDEYLGDSRSFDAINDYMTIADNAALEPNDYTVSMWVDIDDLSTQRVALSHHDNANEAAYVVVLRTDSHIRNFIKNGATSQCTVESNDAALDTTAGWQYITMSMDDTNNEVRFYVNGSPDSGNPKTCTTSPGEPTTTVWIGRHANGAQFFDGLMDEIRIKNIEDSADWINSDYECQRQDNNNSCITIGAEGTEPSAGGNTRSVTDEIALEDSVSYTYDSMVNPSDEIALEDGGATRTTVGADTRSVTDEIALEDGGATASSDTVFVSDEIALEDSASTPAQPEQVFNAIILSLNSPELDRLGGVFALTCPANHTLTGLLTNGTFICTNLDDFFP